MRFGGGSHNLVQTFRGTPTEGEKGIGLTDNQLTMNESGLYRHLLDGDIPIEGQGTREKCYAATRRDGAISTPGRDWAIPTPGRDGDISTPGGVQTAVRLQLTYLPSSNGL